MAQGPSDTILVAIRITLRIWESKVQNTDPLDRRRFVLSEHSFLVHDLLFLPISTIESAAGKRLITHCRVSRRLVHA